MVGLMATFFQEGLCHTHVYYPEPLPLQQSTVPLQETLKHSSASVSVGSLGLGMHKVCLSPQSVSGGYGV